jgi:hypothetical protein
VSHNSLLGLITGVIALGIVAPIAMVQFRRRWKGMRGEEGPPSNDTPDDPR